MIIGKRMLASFAEIEACGYSITVTACFYELSGDEGRTHQKVYISEADLLHTDAQDAAARRAKMTVVNGGRQ
jgi:hypothetical protein